MKRERVTRFLRFAVATALLLISPLAARATNDPADIARFHGVWIGQSVFAEQPWQGPAVMASDISVTIRATDSGFELTWKDLHRGGPGWLTARFVAATEPGTFGLAHADPPLGRDETLRAQVDGNHLVVELAGDDIDRTTRVSRYRLTEAGNRMTYSYTHLRGGQVLNHVTGSLSRAKILL